jgi:hypothetical protein
MDLVAAAITAHDCIQPGRPNSSSDCKKNALTQAKYYGNGVLELETSLTAAAAVATETLYLLPPQFPLSSDQCQRKGIA